MCFKGTWVLGWLERTAAMSPNVTLGGDENIKKDREDLEDPPIDVDDNDHCT
jgi:hypothetical protein